MSYYTALITAWNAGTVPNGVTGSPLTGLPTAQKLANINAWTVAGPALPPNIPVTNIIAAINPTDFLALTALQLQELQFLLQSAETVFAPISGTIRSVFSTIFTGKTTTLNNLSTLVAQYDSPPIPWVTAPNGAGLNSPVSQNDLTEAGLS